jgi:phytanoyl-CoA hydroxylase
MIAAPAPAPVADADILSYREQGFVRLRGMLTPTEVERYRAAVDDAVARDLGRFASQSQVFRQVVNLWESQPVLRELTFHPRIIAAARALAGVPLRLWHDQALIKPPAGKPTVYHQGQTNWSHICRPDSHALTVWVALNDVPVEMGCMGFIPGSHRHWDLGRQENLQDPRGLYRLRPEFEWEQNIRLPLRAGDLTVHHAFTAHNAGPNTTDQHRYGFIIDFMDDDTRYRPIPHVLTDDLNLSPGDLLDHPRFPLV